MNKYEINESYFCWLYDIACAKRYSKDISYRKLLRRLHSTSFEYIIKKDKARALDGEDLRYRFANESDIGSVDLIIECFDYPCTVLEMIVALAVRCEETIMDDPAFGDRTTQWFWNMVNNLGLGNMNDNRYDEEYVDERINNFLQRNYDPNGRGGLFTIKECEYDLRRVEIWTIMLWYLDYFNHRPIRR